ncbi:ComEC family competence protein [Paludibacteraceae bacterium OttesenSCG-928-F17]|nr:ComEC family competence protein [Paludibacteraceae bacterium OttesenSCG-928-F17]
MDFLQRTPFFRLLIPVIFGIILYQVLELPPWSLLLSIISSATLITISFLLRKSSLQYKFRWLFGCGIFLFLATISYFLSFKTEEKNRFEHLSEKGKFLVELTHAPVEKARSYLCKIKVLQFSDSITTHTSYGNAYLYLQKDSIVPTLLHGDRLIVETEFNPPETMRNPDGFDYGVYLERQGVGATAYASSENWVKAGRNKKTSVLLWANKCRNYLLDTYKKHGITGKEYAVLAALTLGYTDEIDTDLRKSYSTSGAMHILAVSGLHIGIIYAVLAFLFSFLNKSTKLRLVKSIIILLLLWCYAFITGLSPSVFRATLMFSFAAIGAIFSRKSLTYNTIFMSAFLMLLINPNLLFSVSFQLSYSAVLSIIFFQPKISGLFQINSKHLKWLWDLTAVSVAAQLGTAPFVLFYFQAFPNYFLLTNLIAIPLATLILYLAFALLLVSFIPLLPAIIAQLLKWVLLGLNFCIEFIDKLPYATSTIAINHVQILFLFSILFLISYYFHKKSSPALIGVLCAALLFFSINLKINYDTLHSKKLIVYESYRDTHVNVIDGKSNYIYTTNQDDLFRTASTFWNNKKILPPQNIEEYTSFVDGFFLFDGKRILILPEDYGRKYTSSKPFQIDYLIIGNKLKPRIHQLLECINPQMIICDKTITPWYLEQIKKGCEEKGIQFYSIKHQGAFIAEYDE